MSNDFAGPGRHDAPADRPARSWLDHLELALENLQLCVEGLRRAQAGAEHRVPEQRGPAPAHLLSSQELKVAGLMALGRSNQQIASALGLSLHTVKNHVAKILLKLDARSRTEATAVLLGHGGTRGQERAGPWSDG